MIRWIVAVAGTIGCIGVVIGAYAAHGLEASLLEQGLETADVAKRLDQCEVAVRYHMVHTLALLAVGLTAQSACRRRRAVAAGFFLLGIALFSGGLYSMVFLGVMGHWAIVPCGGLSFMAGWIGIALLAFGKSDVC